MHQWYYLSAIANNGLGNNVVALEPAKTGGSHGAGKNGIQALVSRRRAAEDGMTR